MTYAILFTVVIVLVLINGLFVAAEFAIIGSRSSRLQAQADQGNPAAAAIQAVVDSPKALDDYVSTAQVGITLASLGLGMYGEQELAHIIDPYLHQFDLPGISSHALAAIIAISILTYLHIVIGEMIPKAVALQQPESTALSIATAMQVSRTVFWPIVAPLSWLGRAVLRLMGVPDPTAEERVLSAEELGMVITQSAAGGLLTDREGRIMLRIFDFAEREAHQVMTPRTRMEALSVDIELEELTERLVASPHTRLPVFEGDIDHILGILHIKDFVKWRLDGDGEFDLQALLRPARVVPEHMSIERLLEAFREEHGHFGVVIDEYGGTAGVVTLEDLAEEIVGEVQDEFDVELPPVRLIRTGLLEVRGDLQLADLADYGHLPDDLPDVDTVGGLIVTLLGRPAEVEDRIQLEDVTFEVVTVTGHAVELARVSFDGREERSGFGNRQPGPSQGQSGADEGQSDSGGGPPVSDDDPRGSDGGPPGSSGPSGSNSVVT